MGRAAIVGFCCVALGCAARRSAPVAEDDRARPDGGAAFVVAVGVPPDARRPEVTAAVAADPAAAEALVDGRIEISVDHTKQPCRADSPPDCPCFVGVSIVTGDGRRVVLEDHGCRLEPRCSSHVVCRYQAGEQVRVPALLIGCDGTLCTATVDPARRVRATFADCGQGGRVGQRGSASGVTCELVCKVLEKKGCLHRAAQADYDACLPHDPERSGSCADVFQPGWSSQCVCAP